MKNPLVTVIIPFLNSEKYLANTIQSVLDQTWKNIELILVNDGSTDGSQKIASKFTGANVIALRQQSRGASAARNLGIKNSSGEYLQFLDADDLLAKDKIETQIEALLGTSNKIALCSTVHFNDGEDYLHDQPSLYEESFLTSTDHPIDFLIKLWGGIDGRGSMIQPNAWLLPKQLIKRGGLWDENLTLDDDGEFFARMILNSDGIVKTKSFNYYRKFKTGKNLSAIKSKNNLVSQLQAILSKKKELLARTDKLEAKRAIDRQLMDLAYLSYPKHKDIIKIIESNLVYGHSINPTSGGYIIKSISKIFGWKFAKLLQTIE